MLGIVRFLFFGLIYGVFSLLYQLTRNALLWRATVRRLVGLYLMISVIAYWVLGINLAPFLLPFSLGKLIVTAILLLVTILLAWLLTLNIYQDTFIAIKDSAKVHMMPAKPPPLPPSLVDEALPNNLPEMAHAPQEKVRIATQGVTQPISHQDMAKHLTPELKQLLNIRQ